MSLREGLRELLASAEEIAADEERADAAQHGLSQCCADAPLRRTADLVGVVQSVVLRPRKGVPALEAELFDGTGTLALVWLGRRQIAGIEPGRRMLVHGFVCDVDGTRTIYNPRYELRARPGE
jgi:hypothetical protein